MRYCFAEAGFKRLTCGHFADNPASARVIKKLGFRRIGDGATWCEARKSEVPTIRYLRRRPLLAGWRRPHDEVSRSGQDLHHVRRGR